jgi:pimeloyl-ACP methyl ester carboxylesterase
MRQDSTLRTRNRALILAALSGAAFAGLYAYALRSVQRFEDLDPEEVDKPGNELEVSSVRVHFVEAGEGAPLILIHGFGASTFGFRHTIPELARHFRAIALDLKGFGLSERPPGGDYSLTAQARLVSEFMEGMGIQRAAVLGHSMGGEIAMRLAINHPERVERLILVDSAGGREARYRGTGGSFLRPLLPVVALFTLHSRRFRSLSLRSGVYDPAYLTPEVLEGYFRPTRIRGHLRGLGELLTSRRNDPPLDPSAIVQPTLILWGEKDRWLPVSQGQRLHEQIPGSQIVIIPKAGHLPLEEQPDESNRAILEFLQTTEAAPATGEG